VLQKFQLHIAQWCKTTDKILLAVSGGLDSMAMLHLFVESGYKVAVAHCNFQLRGLESDEDERWLSAYCEKRKIPFHSNRFHTNNYAIAHSVSIQMAARELRYQWFKELHESQGMSWIATAHHHNDSIETILLNLAKGTSLNGLQGIAAVNGHLLRPLLYATRHELETFVAEKGIPWREDQSNQTDDYQRNFIRHQLVPRFLELNPAFELSMTKTAMKLEGSLLLANQAVSDWKKLYWRSEGDAFHLVKAGFGNQNSEGYNLAILWELLKEYGFHYDQCRQILMALHSQPGKKFLTALHALTIDRELLVLAPLRTTFTDAVITIQKDQTKAFCFEHTLTIQKSVKSEEFDRNRMIATLDEQLLRFPITWRKWKEGDWFIPLGMKNRKKISDFLIDTKVSLAAKETVTVLESGGEIIWVAGHRIDDRFKVTESTADVLVFHLVKDDKIQ
jgi:tRNA(Ile)-lysidine synthase